MLSIYCPNQIPLHFFFFGWKKAVRHLQTDSGIYDPVEVELFNRNLFKNLKELQMLFSIGEYKTDSTLTYLLPKSMDASKKRARPMVQFSFRDQIAWATVMLVLGEWFDTSEEMEKHIPLHQTKLRQKYRWMVPWSFNNRIKRIHQLNDSDRNSKRLMLNYNDKEMYESFQWGLRNLKESRKTYFEEIRSIHGDVYFGELDIQEFFPSLKMSFVLNAIQCRFEQLESLDPEIKYCSKQWMNLLNKLSNFDINFTETLEHADTNDLESVKQLKKNINTGDQNSLTEFLKDTLPIGLIASGFLANCALTHYLDNPLEVYVKSLLSNSKNDRFYILRYTDDMTFISNSNNFIVKVMDKTIQCLNTLNLQISNQKTKPQEYQYDSTRSNDDITKLIQAVPVVKKRHRIPGSTAVVEKLSKLGEHKLYAMNHENLLNYMNELMNLMVTKYDPNEIKDETKVTFAAWRLQRSAAEISYRKLASFEYMKVPDVLLDAVFEFPYKTSLIEIYILNLFQSANDEDLLTKLNKFMRYFRQSSESPTFLDKDDHLGSYGAYLRTCLLMAIDNYWFLVPLVMRERVNDILFEQLSTWYVSPPTWHETTSIYRLLAKTNLKLDPGAVNVSLIQAAPPQVTHMFRLFQSISQVKEALFLTTPNGDFHRNNLANLQVVLQIFYQRKPKEHRIHRLLLPDEEHWIRWCWSILLKEINHKKSLAYKKFVLCLARYAKTLVPIHGFQTLLEPYPDKGEHPQEDEEDRILYCNELLQFLDEIIEDWIDYSINKGHVSIFLESLSSVNGAPSKAIEYVKQRLTNLAWIKLHICKSHNGISELPYFVLDQVQSSKKGQSQISPALIDWVAITASRTMSKEDKYMHKLSEYEIVYIVRFLADKLNDEKVDIQDIRIRNVTISPKNWNSWRKGIIERVNTRKLDKHWQQTQSTTNIKNDPDWFYIERALNYMDDSDTSLEQKGFKHCFVLTVLLVQLLSHGRLNASAFDFSKILSWKGVQYVIDECNAPSSSVTSLITSTVNYFYLFYKKMYAQLGNIKIPYHPVISKETVDLELFLQKISEIEKTKSQQYLYCEHGFLEIQVENIDLWTKGTELC